MNNPNNTKNDTVVSGHNKQLLLSQKLDHRFTDVLNLTTAMKIADVIQGSFRKQHQLDTKNNNNKDSSSFHYVPGMKEAAFTMLCGIACFYPIRRYVLNTWKKMDGNPSQLDIFLIPLGTVQIFQCTLYVGSIYGCTDQLHCFNQLSLPKINHTNSNYTTNTNNVKEKFHHSTSPILDTTTTSSIETTETTTTTSKPSRVLDMVCRTDPTMQELLQRYNTTTNAPEPRDSDNDDSDNNKEETIQYGINPTNIKESTNDNGSGSSDSTDTTTSFFRIPDDWTINQKRTIRELQTTIQRCYHYQVWVDQTIAATKAKAAEATTTSASSSSSSEEKKSFQ